MAENSKISWTTHTLNCWSGCTKVHEGCTHCYAETLSKRWGNDVWGNDKPRKEVKSAWNDLIKFQKKAEEANEIHRVFIGSMMDIFEKPMPLINSKGEKLDETTGDLRDHFFKNICNAPNLLFLLLTKRPSNINKYIPEDWKLNPPHNVMFGTSPVNQETANTLIPQLLKVNGKRFLSIEPQLGYINITEACKTSVIAKGFSYLEYEQIHWVINGGESGHNRRPFNLEWARSLRDQCKSANVPYFFKQIDKVIDKEFGIPEDLQIQEFPVI